MTKPKRADELNILPCWKVRIYMRGGNVIHVLSKTEPKITHENGKIIDLEMVCITGTEHGDTIGFIDWLEVSAASWRFAQSETEKSKGPDITSDQRVIEYLDAHPNGANRRTIAVAIGMQEKTAGAALCRLEEKGLASCKRGGQHEGKIWTLNR